MTKQVLGLEGAGPQILQTSAQLIKILKSDQQVKQELGIPMRPAILEVNLIRLFPDCS